MPFARRVSSIAMANSSTIEGMATPHSWIRHRRRDHLALFGNIALTRVYCPDCESTAFVIQKKLACCNKPYDPNPQLYKRECEPEQHRSIPPPGVRKDILALQANCCFYCDREFGSRIYLKRKMIRLKLQWDHLVPYSYSQNNQTDNFVAACHKCNVWKGALMFQTIEDARVFLASKWESKDR